MNFLAILSPHRATNLIKGASLTGMPLTWAAISYNTYQSIAWWMLMAALAMFYVVLRNGFMRSHQLRVLMTILFALGALQALYGIIQALVPSVGILWTDKGAEGVARGTYVNRNHFAGFIEMIFPLCLGYRLSFVDWEHRGSKKKGLKTLLTHNQESPTFLFSIILVVLLVAVLFSQSRAGITSTGLGFIIFSVLVFIANKHLPLGFWLSIVFILGLTLIYGLRIGFDDIIARFLELDTDTNRLKVWADTSNILRDHPLGIGLRNFKQLFPVYRVQTLGSSQYLYAHNDVLQLLTEA